MHEKIQRFNKRAKQNNLTILQVPAMIHKKDVNVFKSNIKILCPSVETISYLFMYDYLWMFMDFYLIDKYPTSRTFIHNSGCAFLKIKRKDRSIKWEDNTALSNSSDNASRKNTFKRASGTFVCLDILMDIIINNTVFGYNANDVRQNAFSSTALPSQYSTMNSDFIDPRLSYMIPEDSPSNYCK